MPAGSTSATRLLRTHIKEALRDMDPGVTEPLAGFATWEALFALWETGWLGAGRPTVSALRMDLRRRLRELAASACPCAAVIDLPPGTRVLLDGQIAGEVGAPPAGAPQVLLEDRSGVTVAIDISGARLVAAAENRDQRAPLFALGPRIAVSVLGFADREVVATAPQIGREPPWRGRVRGGPTLPLVVAPRFGVETPRGAR